MESTTGGTGRWDADVLLADGSVVFVRPPRVSDRKAMRDFMDRQSDESLALRYFGVNRRSAEADVERILSSPEDELVCILTLQGSTVISLGYMVRADDGGPTAEVAFLVDDEHHHRGIGSLVLEHLADIARERGIAHFTAEVLPENRAMIGVFKDAGFGVFARYEEGLILVTMDIAESEKSIEVRRAREHAAEARSIAGVLRPRSVAVLGAGRSQSSYGHMALRSLLAPPFNGPVYPLNPHADHVAGVASYAKVEDVPGPVDLVVVATPPGVLEGQMPELARAGVRAAVVLTSYHSAGPGPTEQLVETARRLGIRVLGPECMGVMNTDPDFSLNGTLLPALPPAGRVGFFAQSGSLSADVLDQAQRRSVGVSTMVSAGDRADISANDLLQYWLSDDSTDVVLLYLESLGNPVKFARIARAVSRQKPVIAVQAVAGAEQGRYETLFAQAGVIRVDSLTEMLDVTVLLQRMPLPAGKRVAVIDNVSSLGGIATTTAEHLGLVRSPASESLPPTVSTRDFLERVRAAIEDPETDSVVLAFVAHLAEVEGSGPQLEQVLGQTSKPVVLTTLQNIRTTLPTYGSPEAAVRALGQVTTYASWRRQDPGGTPHLRDIDRSRAQSVVDDIVASGRRCFSDSEALQFVRSWGIETGPGDEDGVEVVVEVGSDHVLGRAISFAVAGVPLDLMQDRSWRALPITDADALRMVGEIRAAAVLDGWQGGPIVHRPRLAEVVLRLATAGAELPSLENLTVRLSCLGDDIVCMDVDGRVEPDARRYESARRSLDSP